MTLLITQETQEGTKLELYHVLINDALVLEITTKDSQKKRLDINREYKPYLEEAIDNEMEKKKIALLRNYYRNKYPIATYTPFHNFPSEDDMELAFIEITKDKKIRHKFLLEIICDYFDIRWIKNPRKE